MDACESGNKPSLKVLYEGSAASRGRASNGTEMSVATNDSQNDHHPRHGWRGHAACRDTETAFFFPNGETGEALVQAEAAKAVCADCPVRLECLEFAMVTNQPYGIFGGLTESERKLLRRRRGRERRDAEAGVVKAS